MIATDAAPAADVKTTNSSAPKSSSRIDGIDVLRGLSIIAVVVHHINLRLRLDNTPLGRHLPKLVLHDLGFNGYNGVIVFFAISGFLITTTCLRRWTSLDQISIRRFYRLRMARILPCLLGLLVILSVLHLLHVKNFTINPQRSSLPRALVAALTLHVNWLEATHGYLPANWDVLWSLSNEEMFYLFFPLLCVFLRRRRAIVGILLGFVALGPFARTMFTPNPLWADCGYLSSMDVIAIGCLAAIVADRIRFPIRVLTAIQVSGGALALLVTIFRTQTAQLGLYKTGLDVTVLGCGTALMMIGFLQKSKTGTRWAAPIRWFGRNSYEVYLTHMMAVFPLLFLATIYDPRQRLAPVTYVVIVCAAGLLGAAVAHFYSEPLNRKLRAQQLPAKSAHFEAAGA